MDVVFAPLLTDILKSSEWYKMCSSTKMSFGHCPVTGSLHREASSVLLVGNAPKWLLKFIPTETEPNSFRQWIIDFLLESESV